MSSQPRTRAERQAQTRAALLAVARDMFLRDGFAATSLDKVAVEAGFSKGAVYSNFEGKEQLCLEVLDLIHDEQVTRVIEALDAESTLDGKLKAFGDWAQASLGEPGWTALEAEFGAVARNNPWVAGQLVHRHRVVRTALGDLLESMLAAEGLRPRTPIDQVATALLSLGAGLGALRSLDPQIDTDIFASAIRSLLRTEPKAG